MHTHTCTHKRTHMHTKTHAHIHRRHKFSRLTTRLSWHVCAARGLAAPCTKVRILLEYLPYLFVCLKSAGSVVAGVQVLWKIVVKDDAYTKTCDVRRKGWCLHKNLRCETQKMMLKQTPAMWDPITLWPGQYSTGLKSWILGHALVVMPSIILQPVPVFNPPPLYLTPPPVFPPPPCI